MSSARPLMKPVDSVLDLIGNTPMVRLNRVAEGIRTTVMAKCEMFNPGASVKDRIGVSMIEAAEREGRLRPGGLVVEATSGPFHSRRRGARRWQRGASHTRAHRDPCRECVVTRPTPSVR